MNDAANKAHRFSKSEISLWCVVQIFKAKSVLNTCHMHTDGGLITSQPESARSASQRFLRATFPKPVSVKRRLQTADCGLWTGDKMRTEGKMHTAEYRLFKKLLRYCVSESLLSGKTE